jgi:hypothetical protein
MDYVDFVEAVLRAVMDHYDEFEPRSRVNIRQIGIDLGLFEIGGMPLSNSDSRLGAVDQALGDLESIGWVRYGREPHCAVTSSGRLALRDGLGVSEGLTSVMSRRLEKDQLAVLHAVAELSQDFHEKFVYVRQVGHQELENKLGWSDSKSRLGNIRGHLEMMGFDAGLETIGEVTFRSTFTGIYRATREVSSRLQGLVKRLLPEWENTNVEFKRQISTKKDNEKAEFVRDILAMGNTNSPGQRYYLIGFDPKTRTFAESVDRKATQDQLEDILNAYANPRPDIRYETCPWETGTIGVIEVIRSSPKVPYLASRPLAGILEAGKAWVRHGSHVEVPSDAELADLFNEGQRARALLEQASVTATRSAGDP